MCAAGFKQKQAAFWKVLFSKQSIKWPWVFFVVFFKSTVIYLGSHFPNCPVLTSGPCRSWSSQVLNVTKVHKTLRSQKVRRLLASRSLSLSLASRPTARFLFCFQSLTELETSKEDGHAGLRRRAVCSLCFKPVHLIQKSLADGKVYHRGCFRWETLVFPGWNELDVCL